MNKPVQHTKKFLNWNEVVEYIKGVHGKDVDDWYGKYTDNEINKGVPFCCFTHWLCDKYGDSDSFFHLYENVLDGATSYEDLEDEPEFVKEIHEVIFKEFGEYAVDGWLEFMVE